MKINKAQVIIGAFILFWVIFLGWAMIKSTFKLSSGKSAGGQTDSKLDLLGSILPQQKTTESEKTPPPARQESETVRPLVRTLRIKTVDFRDVLPVMGSVKGKTEIDLKFEINGVVKKIYFHEGEVIKQGDLIAELDPKDAQLKAAYAKNKFNSAEAAYKSALKKLEIHKSLYDSGAIIKSKLEEVELETDSARYQTETARSEMDLAENELKKVTLFAIKDGVMGQREAEEGEFVTPQDKVAALYEISEVYVEVGVVERDIEKVKVGQKAKIFVDSYPNTTFEGKVDYIFPIVEGKSRTLTVKITVPNPDRMLLPGMFCRAEILIIELQQALIIPVTSLIYTKTGNILLPVIPKESIRKQEDEMEIGVLRLRNVSLGYKTSDYAQLKEGAKEDDQVILESQGEAKLDDNIEVRIIGTEEVNF
ncbi:MAG: efflux RND transporter periplasmic adaptor subunit [Candidatus Omnitrophica bacterium]|nr:efflux RND transporter periplasmic adaptor subunit [Candidatus Omnitrophota bacterium]